MGGGGGNGGGGIVQLEVKAIYHDDPNRLHWFVPEEISDLDKASALDPEGTRAKLAAESLIASSLDD